MPVFRRKERIVVKFQIAGVIYRRTVPEATSIAQGKVVEAQMKLEIFEGRYGAGKDALFSDFVELQFKPYWAGNFKSNMKWTLDAFKRAFKGKYLKDIAHLTIEGWKRKRMTTNTLMGRPPHLATIQNELALLSSIFELACDNDFISKNPMRKVRRFTQAQIVCKRERLFVDDEEVRLESVLERRGGEIYWAYMIARHTGMRQGEVLRLKRTDVSQNTIIIRESKNGRPRTLPIPDELRPIFQQMPTDRDGYFFSMRTGCSFSGKGSAWSRALEEAGITDFRYHDVRHVFASSLPPDPYVRQAWLGHSKVETSSIYSHVTLEQMKQAAETAKVLNFERTAQIQRKPEKKRGIAR